MCNETLMKLYGYVFNDLDKKMHLPLVQKMQLNNPNLIIGGSISLYLRGIVLDRFSNSDTTVDLDITIPFYQEIEGVSYNAQEVESRPSGSDYAETLLIEGVKADLRIDPKLKYEKLNYKGMLFKIVPLEIVIEAKSRYAISNWGTKHKNDLREMILKT